MRLVRLALLCSALFAPGMALADEAPGNKQHPGNVALVEDGADWVYKQFPTMLRLYVFDDDKPGAFGCADDCLLRWPPLYAPSGAKKVGQWTPVKRADGQLQWAYKGRPAYMRYHDSVSAPMGHKVDAKWHLLDP